jgi:hypothetical protein
VNVLMNWRYLGWIGWGLTAARLALGRCVVGFWLVLLGWMIISAGNGNVHDGTPLNPHDFQLYRVSWRCVA